MCEHIILTQHQYVDIGNSAIVCHVSSSEHIKMHPMHNAETVKLLCLDPWPEISPLLLHALPSYIFV